jgi:hypothetical protein
VADLAYDVDRLALVTIQLDEPQPCRWCARPTWMADVDGPTHRCCNAWQIVGKLCPGCAESANAWREFDRRRADRAADARRRAKGRRG